MRTVSELIFFVKHKSLTVSRPTLKLMGGRGTNDESGFKMQLLHFRRTFVGKLFAIHSKVEIFKKTGRGIGGYARHYYDLFCLAQRPNQK